MSIVDLLQAVIIEHIKLIERPMGSDDARGSGLALMLRVMVNGIEAVLYRANEMKLGIEKNETTRQLSNYVVGVISTSKKGDVNFIDYVAAEKGWGPFMYDIAMVNAPNGLAPDRLNVSQDARRVWQRYFERDDIKKIPLIGSNRTHNDDVLDFAYKLIGYGHTTDALEDVHEHIDSNIEGGAISSIASAGATFFRRKAAI